MSEDTGKAQRPETILLVDDTPTNLQVLYQTLNDLGHRLLIAQSGEQALAIANKNRPTLVLLDIMMPGMDGYEVCRQIKGDSKLSDISVIFLSALDDTADKLQGFRAGGVDYITKPFQPDEVIARVQTHLKLRGLERNLSERNRALEAANLQMRQDLEAAARIQQALLPNDSPSLPGVEVAWHYRPCQELAGDALNLFALDDRRLALFVLDVCGHGVPAALLAVAVSHELRIARVGSPAAQQRLHQPAEVARRLNRLFPMDSRSRVYFTLLYGVLDTTRGTFDFASAGNQGPTLIRQDGKSESLDVPAIPIGLFPDSDYQTSQIQLRPGDRLYLHTDGLSEERNSERQEFGRARLVEALDAQRSVSLTQGLEALVARVQSWAGQHQLGDDVAIIGVQYR